MPMTLSGTSGGASLAANGYTYLPNGALIQWGSVASTTTNGTTAVTFPIAFPTACQSVVVSANGTFVTNQGQTWTATSITTTGFNASYYNTGGGAAAGARFLAIGY